MKSSVLTKVTNRLEVSLGTGNIYFRMLDTFNEEKVSSVVYKRS